MSTNQDLSAGRVLGRYELLLPIAQGGMATVWAARQKGSRGFQKTVAIKTMLPALSDDPQFERMFLEEAGLAARIHHPNVAEILDLGEEDDIVYIVMEWVDGEALSLISRASKKNNILVPQRVALRIVGNACMGLHAAHELRDENDLPIGLVHRDVSPQNILVTYDGHVKLVDFGVAKATNRSSGETNAGQLKGKIPYMSPEQARGGQVDRRTDIFAMGIVLYKLTTGGHPFVGENDLLTMRNIITRPPLPPRAKNPRYSPDLEQIVMKCLQKDPDKRYQTMLELERAVQWVLAKGAPVTDDDVGTFVRSLMGDRNQKRKAALRDAVRSLDERPTMPGIIMHEQVSEIVLTQMNSSVRGDLIPPSTESIPPPMPGMPSDVDQTSLSHMHPVDFNPPKRRRSGVIVAIAAVTMIAVVGIGLALFGGGGTTPTAANQPTGPEISATPLVEPPPAAPTIQPVATIASGSVSPSLDVSALPEQKPATTTPSRSGPRTAAGTKSTSQPSAAPTKPVSTKWVPSVTNPGF